MPVRCPECGHENDAQFKYCGMCGVSLRVTAAPSTGRDDRSSVSGPSFLGLETEPSRRGHYLLEEEEPRGHGRLYFGLLLMLLAAGGLVWHWQRTGYPWQTRPWERPAAVNQPSPEQPEAATNTPPPPQQTEPEHPAAATPLNPEQQTAGSKPAEESAPTDEAPAPDTGEDQSVKVEAKEEPAEPAPAKAAPKKEEVASIKVPKPVKRAVVPPPEPEEDPSESLFTQGQKYLYGNGVPENCALARRSLMAAAARSNPKALSTVGTMYATGHCVDRDLPSAYRWYARALHLDRDNIRLQQNLEALWRQMSPEERQAAQRGQ